MKVIGIILVIAGIGGIINFIASGGQMVGNPGYILVFLVLGAYLIHRANQKKEDQADKERWEKGE